MRNVSTLSRNSVKRIGDSGHPYLTPSLKGMALEQLLVGFILAIIFSYNSYICAIKSAVIPNSCCSALHNRNLLTLSNAF